MSITKFPGPQRLAEFRSFSPAKWIGRRPPPIAWMVENCFPLGATCGLSGDGGVGKSLLLQQLMTAAALGVPWLGLETRQVKAYGFFCEDDEDDLWRRQEDINRHYGCSMDDIAEHVTFCSRKGLENILVEFDRRNDRAEPTSLFHQLFADVTECGAQLVGIDTAADTFGGQEYVRNQVRRFITEFTREAMRRQGTVIMTQHPSVEGPREGSGRSGSTAWNNSFRARAYLTRPTGKEGDEEAETTPDRVFKVKKSNYSRSGDFIRLRWEEGVFVVVDGTTDGATAAAMNIVDRLDLDNRLVMCLRDLVLNGTMVTANIDSARTGFANIMRRQPGFTGLTQRTMKAAQDRLIDNKRIVRVELGPPSKRRVYLRPADATYPGEAGQEPKLL
jgi:hypothetical protein